MVYYIQKMGYAMGTVCAPSYASQSMAQYEKRHIYPYIKDIALLYLKYTDDKFIIWKGTKGQLIAFANESNETR